MALATHHCNLRLQSKALLHLFIDKDQVHLVVPPLAKKMVCDFRGQSH